MGKVKVFNPIGQSTIKKIKLAKRLDTLSGEVIGFIDNTRPNVGLFLKYIIEELLNDDFENVETITVCKALPTGPAPISELEDKVAGVVNVWGN
jgi:hypothetical protein